MIRILLVSVLLLTSVPVLPSTFIQGGRIVDELPARTQKKLREAANRERHSQAKRDSERLLQLATDLKLQVDREDAQALPSSARQKAQEIEKLAHSVQTKMRGYN